MQPAGGVELAPRLPRLPGLAVSDGLSGRLAGAAAASANGQRDREAASACGGCARKAADAGQCRARLTVAFGLSLHELAECLSDASWLAALQARQTGNVRTGQAQGRRPAPLRRRMNAGTIASASRGERSRPT